MDQSILWHLTGGCTHNSREMQDFKLNALLFQYIPVADQIVFLQETFPEARVEVDPEYTTVKVTIGEVVVTGISPFGPETVMMIASPYVKKFGAGCLGLYGVA